MMNKILLLALLVIGLVGTVPAKANYLIDGSGSVVRSQILGDEVEKKEEKKDDKKEVKEVKEVKMEINKEIKKEEGKSKIEIQKGPIKLKIEQENGVLKIKGKDENGKEFEMETEEDERVEIRDEEDPENDFEIASGTGDDNTVKIKKGGVEAETQLSVTLDTKTKKLSVEGREIKVLPEEAVKNAGVIQTKIEIKNRGQETVYEITGEEKKKLFGFIDFTFSKISVVSADTGKILESTQAWWSSLLENFAR